MTTVLPIVQLCKITDVSRAGYYKWLAARDARHIRKDAEIHVRLGICLLECVAGAFIYRVALTNP